MSTTSPAPSASRRTWAWVVVACVVVVAVVVAVIWATRPDDDAATPAPTSSTTTVTETTPAQTPTTTESTSAAPTGCAPTDETAPEGADVVEVVDVDGDGREDQGWISGGAGRRFGITTASGATFSTTIESASPEPAAAVVQVIQQDLIPIALVDTGREALLYSLADCAVTPVQNAQGQPYTFDRGFGGAGTGVGCTEVDGVLRLAGLNAVSDDDGETFDVTRTYVDLDADGRHATNGEPEQVATGAPKANAVVTTAQEVSCGELVAGKDGPVEPLS
ncbi:MAG TPA: hypothetical protein VNR62_06540 [Cellulomonas sp.]|nr:hypothetical protein [Cellulomonas sp.]